MIVSRTLPELLANAVKAAPQSVALVHQDTKLTFADLAVQTERVGAALIRLGLKRHDRVAVYLNKSVEVVISLLAATRIGCIFVPLNPLLKPSQVQHILADCAPRLLITSTSRLARLEGQMDLTSLTVCTVDQDGEMTLPAHCTWQQFLHDSRPAHPAILESDPAIILYTSGSTGRPKGVVLSHGNVVTGAVSVAQYLENAPGDRILAVLPLSFDTGLSQITTAMASQAQVVLLEYLFPQDVVRACERHGITGITGVPPLWVQLAEQEWPSGASQNLRYFASTGGSMPQPTLQRLRNVFANARPYLMYGLTEAFRSTYLPPCEIDRRPDSIGKSIPNAEVMVVDDLGYPCPPGKPGELVHRGPLVAMGYWKDPERTAEVFRPLPIGLPEVPKSETAVWSGDIVVSDDDGFLYFVGRKDEMIKSSGYRISPTEIEEIAYASGLVLEAAAVGVPDPRLGHSISLVAVPKGNATSNALRRYFRRVAPLYMVPTSIRWCESLPRSPNGKIDRQRLKESMACQEGGVPHLR